MRSRVLVALALFAIAGRASAQDPDSRPETRPDSRPEALEGADSRSEDRSESRPRRPRRPRPETGPATRAETRPESGPASKPAESPFLAIVKGTVYPVSGPVIRQGTVLIKDGKIVEVGRNVQIPPGARILDARNKHVAPGFVAVRAFGTFGTSFSARGEEKTPDQADPYSQSMLMALSSGITTACEGGSPSPQGQLGGFIGKHTFGSLDGMTLREPAALFLQYSSGDMSARYQTRELLKKAAEYRAKMKAYAAEVAEGRKDAKPPTADVAQKNVVRAMDGELPCFVQGTTSLDLNGIADLSIEFGLPVVIQDAREAWTMTGKLARAGASVILNPRSRGPEGNEPTQFQEDPSGWSIENAAKLEQAGIRWCVQPLSPFVSTNGIAGRDLLQLNMDAAFTVRGGVSEEAALRAVTLGAAEILKVDDRVGSIEAGKDADISIFDLDPLDYRSFAETVLVNGKVVYEKQKVSFFDHIQTDRSKGLRGRWWNER